MSAGSKVCKQREGMRDEREQGTDGWLRGGQGEGVAMLGSLLAQHFIAPHPHNYAHTSEVH